MKDREARCVTVHGVSKSGTLPGPSFLVFFFSLYPVEESGIMDQEILSFLFLSLSLFAFPIPLPLPLSYFPSLSLIFPET